MNVTRYSWIPAAIAPLLLVGSFATLLHAQAWPDEHNDPPFHYHADFTLEKYHSLLKSVTALQHEIPQILGVQTLDEPVHVFLFQRERTYTAYVHQYFPTVPNRPALFIKQRGPGMVFAHVSPRLDEDLRHETTHAVLHGILPMVPLWLDEGLGEYFEVPADARRTAHPHLPDIQYAARKGRVPKIRSLEAIAQLSEMKLEHYRDAWSWVHFLLHYSEQSRAVLVSFLREIEASSPPGTLSDRLRRELPDYEQAYLSHFRDNGRKPNRDRFRLSRLLGR